jgi:hypothetical protein
VYTKYMLISGIFAMVAGMFCTIVSVDLWAIIVGLGTEVIGAICIIRYIYLWKRG